MPVRTKARRLAVGGASCTIALAMGTGAAPPAAAAAAADFPGYGFNISSSSGRAEAGTKSGIPFGSIVVFQPSPALPYANVWRAVGPGFTGPDGRRYSQVRHYQTGLCLQALPVTAGQYLFGEDCSPTTVQQFWSVEDRSETVCTGTPPWPACWVSTYTLLRQYLEPNKVVKNKNGLPVLAPQYGSWVAPAERIKVAHTPGPPR